MTFSKLYACLAAVAVIAFVCGVWCMVKDWPHVSQSNPVIVTVDAVVDQSTYTPRILFGW